MGNSIETPLMRQFLEIKSQYRDSLLFFRMGDFYEMFFDDAVVAAEALELTLTSRDRNKAEGVPMCGVPHHAVTGYIHKLLSLGHKVAICEQVEDPKLAKGLVKRAVTQVITPGVVLDTEHLDAKSNNYLVAITVGKDKFGIAALDLSTFELRTTEVAGRSALQDELARLRPKEIIYHTAAHETLAELIKSFPAAWEPIAQSKLLDEDQTLVEEKGGGSLQELGLLKTPLSFSACASALRYVDSTQPATGIPACRLVPYCSAEHLQIDETTIQNLELFCSSMERSRKGSLIGVLDSTLTAMGGRMFNHWISMPLQDVAAIRRRQDAVEFFVDQASQRRALREALHQVYDLERLTARTVMKVVTPRELSRLGKSLLLLPDIVGTLQRARCETLSGELPELLHPPEDLMTDVATTIEQALVDDPPVLTKDGGIIRPGFNAALDQLVVLAEGGKSAILAIESRERERTGISSLKVKYNRVFGYFIEVTRSNLKNVPDDYQRKQTLANAERYMTEELSDYEARVLGAEEQRISLEHDLFETVRQQVAAHAERLTALARWIAALDVLAGLAEVAQRYDYCRPQVDDGELIEIEAGRHPVVERFMDSGQFVPNDLLLDPKNGRMLILTGPNMAGKSTVMRQTALITIMAQMGSFIPARSATIGTVDRIFTRVGASDNLVRGESTFMVEMRETAAILRQATSKSLVVLDEIGRGTSTYDGISIAWAVSEYLHDRVMAKCLFATHYHELCALADFKSHVRNYNIAIQEWQGRVVFLRKLVPGGSSRSYGIEVARLAGLHRPVLVRARQVLAALESGEAMAGLPNRGRIIEDSPAQLGLFSQPNARIVSQGERQVLEQLSLANPDQMSPLEALNYLAKLKSELLE